MEIVNPLKLPDWDENLKSLQNATFFHTQAWANVLSESYGYKPIYVLERKKNKLTALLPLMEISSLLTGKRGVSLPFTDHCETLKSDSNSLHELFDDVMIFGNKADWKYLEIRGQANFNNAIKPFQKFNGHNLNLSKEQDLLVRGIKNNFIRNIRKAERENVKCEIHNSLKAVQEFYRLNCMTRKNHGQPPQPYRFFLKLYSYIISQNKGKVFLAVHDDKVISGAIFFEHQKNVIYKYGASNSKFHHLRPNNLVMYTAIKWYAQNGFKNLDFGRTDIENAGLNRYKSGWGSKSTVISYYRYDFKSEKFAPAKNGSSVSYEKIFRKLPISLLEVIGKIAYKHVG